MAPSATTGRQRYQWLLVLVAAALLLGWLVTGGQDADPDGGLPYVDEASLPTEARDVLDRIDAGGPFAYPDNDGVTFENREDLLPDHPIGYYREYTVETAAGVRGPRRIVTGDGGEYYWTDDHYDSFSRIAR